MPVRPNLVVPCGGEKGGACLGVHSLPWGCRWAECWVPLAQSCPGGVLELQEHHGSQGGTCSQVAAHG